MEMFLGIVPVKKVIIVDDHRFLLPQENGKDPEPAHVRPTTLDQIMRDKDHLKDKNVYLLPQPNDFAKKVFYVYYELNDEINKTTT